VQSTKVTCEGNKNLESVLEYKMRFSWKRRKKWKVWM